MRSRAAPHDVLAFVMGWRILKFNFVMGSFRIEIEAVGGHGQDREKKDGEVVNFYEDGNSTPDAIAKSMTEILKHHGSDVQSAKLIHWPGEDSEVVDDLLTGKRSGNF